VKKEEDGVFFFLNKKQKTKKKPKKKKVHRREGAYLSSFTSAVGMKSSSFLLLSKVLQH
jgi:hypothetical protein